VLLPKIVAMPRAWAFLVDYRKSLRGVPVGAGRGVVVFLLDNTGGLVFRF